MKKPFEQIFVEPIVHPVKHRVAEAYLKTSDQGYLSDTSPVAMVVRELAYACHTKDQKLIIALLERTQPYKKLIDKAFGVNMDGPEALDLFMLQCEKNLPEDFYCDELVRIGKFFEDNLRGYVADEDLHSVNPLEPASYLAMTFNNLPSSLILAQRPLRDDDGNFIGKKYDVPLTVKTKERTLRERVEMMIEKMPRKIKPLTFP